MSSGMFEKGVKALMSGTVNLVNDDIVAALYDAGHHTPDLAGDETLADIPDGSLLSERSLTGKVVDGTTFRADAVTFAGVTEGTVTGVLLFKDTGHYDTSLLLCYIDNALELPHTADGSDITLAFDGGANGIFKL